MNTGLVTPDNGMKRDPLQFSTFSPPYDTPESEFFFPEILCNFDLLYIKWKGGNGSKWE